MLVFTILDKKNFLFVNLLELEVGGNFPALRALLNFYRIFHGLIYRKQDLRDEYE